MALITSDRDAQGGGRGLDLNPLNEVLGGILAPGCAMEEQPGSTHPAFQR